MIIPTQTEDSKDAKERLMNVAMKLFGHKGLDGTTTREIAKEANINVSLISYYFESKLGLYRAIIKAHFERVRNIALPEFERLATSQLDQRGYRELLKNIIDGVIEQNTRYPEMKQISFREITSGMPHAGDLFRDHVDPIVEGLTSLFARGQAQKVIRADIHPRLLLMMVINTVEFYVLACKHNAPLTEGCYKMPTESNQLRDDIIKIVLEGAFNE